MCRDAKEKELTGNNYIYSCFACNWSLSYTVQLGSWKGWGLERLLLEALGELLPKANSVL